MHRIMPLALIASTALAALLVMVAQPRETAIQKRRLKDMRTFLIAQAIGGIGCYPQFEQCMGMGGTMESCEAEQNACCTGGIWACGNGASGASPSTSGSNQGNKESSAPAIGKTSLLNKYLSILLYISPAGDLMRKSMNRFRAEEKLNGIAQCTFGIITGKNNPAKTLELDTANKTVEQSVEDAVGRTPAEKPLDYLTSTKNIICTFEKEKSFDYLINPTAESASLATELVALLETKPPEKTIAEIPPEPTPEIPAPKIPAPPAPKKESPIIQRVTTALKLKIIKGWKNLLGIREQGIIRQRSKTTKTDAERRKRNKELEEYFGPIRAGLP